MSEETGDRRIRSRLVDGQSGLACQHDYILQTFVGKIGMDFEQVDVRKCLLVCSVFGLKESAAGTADARTDVKENQAVGS